MPLTQVTQLDAEDAKRQVGRFSCCWASRKQARQDAFVEHLLAMPDVGDDADFARDPSPPRDVELRRSF